MRPKKLRAIDFFCGAGGMTYGFRKAGIDVLGGIDNDGTAKETYEQNNPGSRFVLGDITKLSEAEIKKTFGISKYDKNLVFVGCSPCQYWSKIRTDRARSKKTKSLLLDVARFVQHFLPGYVVIENVPGLCTNRASVLPVFEELLSKLGYKSSSAIINACDFGVPQSRKRFVLIASRVGNIALPTKTVDRPVTVADVLGVRNGFANVSDGHEDTTPFLHTTARLSELNRKRMAKTLADGGTRKAWQNDSKLLINAYRGKRDIFQDVYGRMHWDKPAPTITTRFNSFSNGRFGHPEENRAISIREGATLQSFPHEYRFIERCLGTLTRHIGNAVPPKLAEEIGNVIVKSHTVRKSK
jgi:DNA (cytosine-5)-methyltransferase 1